MRIIKDAAIMTALAFFGAFILVGWIGLVSTPVLIANYYAATFEKEWISYIGMAVTAIEIVFSFSVLAILSNE